MKTSNDLGTKICQALGLDANKVTTVSLLFEPNQPIQIEVGMHDRGDNLEKVDWSELLLGADITINIRKLSED